ncbi:hypothetical protein ACOI22_13130 [Glaciecola sp. 2405UD65-10]|jgi:hypothetical protein|uniref:hypothetical protein n=1 Tax=Glaciecola sp. 2405UD65-10 TaxID=3397244 RepID=UPI003B5BCD7B
MKVNIELDISPAEAREIFGLPDFSELHTSITNDLLKKCEEDPQKAFEMFIKPTMESGMTGFKTYQDMMNTFLNTSSKG